MSLVVAVLLFFQSPLAFSSQDEERMNQLLIELKSKKSDVVPKIEELYNSSKDPNVSLISSYVLATAPAEKLKMHPAFYAQYHLMHNKGLENSDRTMLSRVAGDGFFEKGQFDIALKWYSFGLKTPDLEQDQMEYFTYKIAWSQLNQGNADLAYQTLNQWLEANRPSLLREPMVVDAGRAYAEAQFSKKGPPKTGLKVAQWKDHETEFFLKGYLAGFRRSGNEVGALVTNIEKLPFPAEGMQSLLTASFFEKTPACAVMPLINTQNFQYWKSSALKTRLILCLQDLAKTKKKNTDAYAAVSQYLATFTDLSYQESLLMVEGFKEAKQNKFGCHRLVKISRDDELMNGKDKRKVWQDWLVRASEVCVVEGTNKMFADRTLELSDIWYEIQLEAYLLSLTEFPDSYKSRLIDQWLTRYGWSPQNLKNLEFVGSDLWLENRLEGYTEAVLASKNEAAIQHLFEILSRQRRWEVVLGHSTQIWPSLQKSPLYQSQFLASLLDQNLNEEKIEPNFDLWPDSKTRESLQAGWMGQGGSMTALQNLPVGSEFQHWQQTHEFFVKLQGAEMTREDLISEIPVFIKLARNLQALQWSSQALLKKSKAGLFASMENLKSSIKKVADQDRSHQEWNLIGKELEKWAVKLR